MFSGRPSTMPGNLPLGHQRQQSGRILGELDPADHGDRRGRLTAQIRDGNPDGLVAQIQPADRAVRGQGGQKGCDVFDDHGATPA